MPHVRRHTPAMFGVHTQHGTGEMPLRHIDDLPNHLELATSQFAVEDFARVPQRTFERGTDIVTCYVMLRGHVTAQTLQRILENVRRHNPERHYEFSNVIILPVGANPKIHQH